LGVVVVALGRAGGAEDAHLSGVAIGGEDFEGVAELLKALVDQLDVAAVGLVAQELKGVDDDLADEVAVGEVG
jgi:hypothetical protein